jgi:hypothetical protein
MAWCVIKCTDFFTFSYLQEVVLYDRVESYLAFGSTFCYKDWAKRGQLYEFLLCPMRAISPTHLSYPNFITVIIFDEAYRL